MILHCANPACGARFLYFGEGKLMAVQLRSSSFSGSSVEFFWVCEECAGRADEQIKADSDIELICQSLALNGHTA